MPRIRRKEKDYWTNRIEQRLEEAIAAWEVANGDVIRELRHQVHAKALAALGAAQLHERLLTVQDEIRRLRATEQEIEEQIQRTALNHRNYSHWDTYTMRCRFEEVLRRTERALEAELLQTHETGRELLRLQRAKESLLDELHQTEEIADVFGLWDEARVIAQEATTFVEETSTTADANN
jgi:uncharacterized small protein (DUF1192 family)